MGSDDESIDKEPVNWKKLRQENSQLIIKKQSSNPLCDDKIKYYNKMALEYEEWMRKHTSLSELLDKLNEKRQLSNLKPQAYPGHCQRLQQLNHQNLNHHLYH